MGERSLTAPARFTKKEYNRLVNRCKARGIEIENILSGLQVERSTTAQTSEKNESDRETLWILEKNEEDPKNYCIIRVGEIKNDKRLLLGQEVLDELERHRPVVTSKKRSLPIIIAVFCLVSGVFLFGFIRPDLVGPLIKPVQEIFVSPTPQLSPTPEATPGPTPTPSPTQRTTVRPTAPPTATPKPEIRILEVILQDEENIYIRPAADGKYFVKPQDKISLDIRLNNPAQFDVNAEYSAAFGKIQDNSYLVPDSPGKEDIITVRIINAATGGLMTQMPLPIKIRRVQ